jgi:hypothetical protein
MPRPPKKSIRAYKNVEADLLELVHAPRAGVSLADLLRMLHIRAKERKFAEMETRTILENVLAHRMHAEEKHPERKSTAAWKQVLQDRLTCLRDWLDELPDVKAKDGASKTAAQLAALCVRLIEELELPLVLPSAEC